uniref:Uncharacterized protein n=1 Tax=Sphaerodactylus townsendi TaxID=933632 RepID=A0ACB8FMM6_9SAUR
MFLTIKMMEFMDRSLLVRHILSYSEDTKLYLRYSICVTMLNVEELMMAMEKVKQELESMKAKLSCTQQSLAEKETHLTNLRAERRKHLEEVLEMK